MAPFIVFSLPRSRSAWLTVFLSAPSRLVGHDIGITSGSPGEFIERLRGPLAGTCETGAAFAWPLIKKRLPEARIAVVVRAPAEVCASLARFGFTGIEAEIAERSRQLERISAAAGVVTIQYQHLTDPQACARLHHHCTGRDMDMAWWRHMDGMNVQVDMAKRTALLHRNGPQIAALKAAVHEEMAVA